MAIIFPLEPLISKILYLRTRATNAIIDSFEKHSFKVRSYTKPLRTLVIIIILWVREAMQLWVLFHLEV